MSKFKFILKILPSEKLAEWLSVYFLVFRDYKGNILNLSKAVKRVNLVLQIDWTARYYC